jgi:predicted nucleotidyltransferase
MTSVLPSVARELGADERTLRRAARRGVVRCSRPGPRRLELAPGELEYLRTHWALLSSLTRALRTEPGVSLAVLYGSAARGDDRADSDVDLLVALRHNAPGAAGALARRLERTVGRSVDVARLDRVERTAPLLLLYALDHGRVLVDRDRRWPTLQARHVQVSRAAREDRKRAREQAARSLSMLIEGDA